MSTDSHEDAKKAIRMVRETYGRDIAFRMLADTEHKVIARYGLLNMGTAPGPRTRRYATPATFILDKQGLVRWRAVEENWKVRPTNGTIIAALERVKRGEDASGVTIRSISLVEDPPEAASLLRSRDGGRIDNMVLIPAGRFKMGAKGRLGRDSEEHEVELDAYYIDKYEVTNRQYRMFLDEIEGSGDHSRCHPSEPRDKDHRPKYWNDPRYNRDDYPVVGVNWYDAYAYCAWVGKQLPTEAQWERAARGGLEGKEYPWGEGGDESRANINRESGENMALLADEGKQVEAHGHGPKPVGSYAPNGFGLFDMTGNVEEWCWDWYDQDYYRRSPRLNPSGPSGGVFKVVRGGSWHHGSGRTYVRYTHTPDQREVFLGFRCAKPARGE